MLFPKQLSQLCKAKGVSVSVAESCTSGLVSHKITSISGSSSYFKGGVIAYNNEIKTKFLDVSKSIILINTEVSIESVTQMSKSVKKDFVTDYAIATSGYAGPSGGNSKNPIGTVFISVSGLLSTHVSRFVFKGDRKSIIDQAANKSLELLCLAIKKQK